VPAVILGLFFTAGQTSFPQDQPVTDDVKKTDKAPASPCSKPLTGTILQRPFGKNTSVKVSALGFGGHHPGDAQDQATA
jgi:hypothetical protein